MAAQPFGNDPQTKHWDVSKPITSYYRTIFWRNKCNKIRNDYLCTILGALNILWANHFGVPKMGPKMPTCFARPWPPRHAGADLQTSETNIFFVIGWSIFLVIHGYIYNIYNIYIWIFMVGIRYIHIYIPSGNLTVCELEAMAHWVRRFT